MDRNSIVGILLIFTILIVFSIINKPSKEQVEAARHRQDSIAQVEALREQQAEQERQNIVPALQEEEALTDTIASDRKLQEKVDQFGIFGNAAIGAQDFFTLENNLMKITFTNKGGKIYSVELKNYQTHDSLPLILFDGDESLFGLNFLDRKSVV